MIKRFIIALNENKMILLDTFYLYDKRSDFEEWFDSRIAPILLYGSEIWGMVNCNIIEGTNLLALKRFLNVPIITPNVFV